MKRRTFNPTPYPKITDYLVERCEAAGVKLWNVVWAGGSVQRHRTVMAFLKGNAYFPVEWIDRVIEGLKLDPAYFLRVYMANYKPELLKLVDKYGDKPPFTAAELKLIAEVRLHSHRMEGVSVTTVPEGTTMIFVR